MNTLWTSQAFFGREELEDAVTGLRRALAGVPAVEGYDGYFDLSYPLLVDLPAGRWDAVADVRPRVVQPGGLAMLQYELDGGMALRRGDLDAARTPLEELRTIALKSGEPQRLVPMAGVVAPYALLTGDRHTLRMLSETVLSAIAREWAQLPTAVPRALAAAGETTLLARVAEAYRLKARDVDVPRVVIGATVADGLLSLAAGKAPGAVSALADAAERERSLGWSYRAACIDLDLAVALDAVGRDAEAEEARSRAAAVLEPLGCVHAY